MKTLLFAGCLSLIVCGCQTLAAEQNAEKVPDAQPAALTFFKKLLLDNAKFEKAEADANWDPMLNRRHCRWNPAVPVLLVAALATAGSVAFAEEPADKKPAYPLWDGQESVEQYAKKVNLPPTRTLDLGNGVKMELVLIPAGKFIMGTPEPTPVDEEGFYKAIVTAKAITAASAGALFVMVGAVIIQAIRKRRKPKFSLARLLAMTVAAGGVVLTGLHWRQSARGLEQARAEHEAALSRFRSASEDEKPAHSVTLTQPFYMGKYVITQQQYQAITGANPSHHFISKVYSVENVSWDDAQAFCKRLSALTPTPIAGKGRWAVRLPTEAEWEYGCRAGTTTTYYSGDTEADLGRVAWYRANSKNTTHPVGQKEPNVFGLYDMHGNVWQWCQDWYGEDYYGKFRADDPQGSKQGVCRVLRGGSSWVGSPGRCRSAGRKWGGPGGHDDSVGFRVVVAPARTP